MTMTVELRMTAITGILELRSGLNPSGESLGLKEQEREKKTDSYMYMTL